MLSAVTDQGETAKGFSHLKEHQSSYLFPVLPLSQKLGLFADRCPVRYFINFQQLFHFCVISENTEGLYAWLDFRGVIFSSAQCGNGFDYLDRRISTCIVQYYFCLI